MLTSAVNGSVKIEEILIKTIFSLLLTAMALGKFSIAQFIRSIDIPKMKIIYVNRFPKLIIQLYSRFNISHSANIGLLFWMFAASFWAIENETEKSDLKVWKLC